MNKKVDEIYNNIINGNTNIYTKEHKIKRDNTPTLEKKQKTYHKTSKDRIKALSYNIECWLIGKYKEKDKKNNKILIFENIKEKRRNEEIDRIYDNARNGIDEFMEEYKLNNKSSKQKAKFKLKIWKDDNKERLKNLSKSWRENNKEKITLIQSRRRERIKNLNRSFIPEEWKKKLQETNGYCPKCKKYYGMNNLTLDHIIPISRAPKGFNYTIDEIQVLCNLKKGIKIQRTNLK